MISISNVKVCVTLKGLLSQLIQPFTTYISSFLVADGSDSEEDPNIRKATVFLHGVDSQVLD